MIRFLHCDHELMSNIANLTVLFLALGVQQQLSVEWHHNGIGEMPVGRINARHWDNSIHVQYISENTYPILLSFILLWSQGLYGLYGPDVCCHQKAVKHYVAAGLRSWSPRIAWPEGIVMVVCTAF